MIGFTALLLPSLVSAVAVFLLSSLIHMVLPWHKGDYARVEREDELMDAVRPFGLPPDDYLVPRPSSSAEMRTPEYAEKLKRGPVMVFTIWPSGSASMTRSLVGWFIYAFVISFVAGHIAARAAGMSPDRYVVLHTVGLSAFLGYAGGLWQMWIWYRRKLSTTLRSTIDGAVYAAATAAIFVWMWPAA